MRIGKLLQVVLAGLLTAGVLVSPLLTGDSRTLETGVKIADGGMPPPPECGLYDICRVSDNS